MHFRALRLFPTFLADSGSPFYPFASTLRIAAGKAWTRRIMAHAPVKTARKLDTRIVAQCQNAGNSTQCKRERRSGALINKSLLSCPTSSIPHSASGCGESSPSLSSNSQADSRPMSNVYDWRERGPSITCPKPETNPRILSQPRPRRKQHVETIPVTHFDPFLNGHEPAEAEKISPNEENTDLFHEILPETRAELLHTVNDQLPTDKAVSLIPPVTQASLYRNLLYLINVRKPTASLPSLVDYHRRYTAFQSTESYNLLIDLSIRHRQSGMTEHLFKSLRHHSVPFNTETHKWMVRYLLQQDLWHDAWRYVRTLQEHKILPCDKNGRPTMPLQIWLEFCRGPKIRRDRSRVMESSTTPDEQFQILHDVRPANIPPLSVTPPFAIFCLVDLMLRSGRHPAAKSLTEAYFKALPRPMTKKYVLGCLRIIHAHLTRCSGKQGLPRFYNARRLLISFLKLHPSLKPNGKTLCLLFKMLQRVKRCGTVAWMHFMKFKKDWGPQVENRRVLLRISQLALKEGRVDIIKKIRNVESACRLVRQSLLREESVVNRRRVSQDHLRRMPYRLIYPGNGKEAQRWYLHRARIRLKYRRMSGSHLMIGSHFGKLKGSNARS